MPSEAHSPASVRSAHTTSSPAPAAQGVGARAAARQASTSPAPPTTRSRASPIDAGVGEHLDVEVLDAPLAALRGEREVDDVREPLARIVDVRLEDLGTRRALPADPEDRAVLEDPQADVGEHRALRVRLHALGGLVPVEADEAQEVLERLAANHDHAEHD